MKIEEMIAANRADCSGCEACANICPKNAITMTRDAEGFVYPKINLDLCIKCGRCDKTCPALNFKKKEITAFPTTFVAIHPDNKILRHSSSGGVFTALSEIILNSGGVVFGAGFNRNWHVLHTKARTFDELENLRGSKYVQSRIGDVYRQVKDALKYQKVLFSGTPCQCAGLKHFLGGDHENLLTVDILCHGTPSPALWESYIGELDSRNEIAHVNFRSKRSGWGTVFEVNYFNRGHYIRKLKDNLYGRLFLNEIISRPSCHNCKFKIPYGKSDLTMGDAWGVKNFAPKMFDFRGVSLVFIHTPKGKDFFEGIKLNSRPVSFGKATSYNPSSIIADNMDPRRESFFADFAKTADKFAVMEKYYYQEDEAIRKKVKKQNSTSFQKNYREIAAQIRKNFKRNILVATSTTDAAAKKSLIADLERNYPNCGIYLLQPAAEGKFICTETFSSLDFEPGAEPDAFTDFAAKFNITDIFIDKDFKFDSTAAINGIAKYIRKNFKRNILVATSTTDAAAKKSLIADLERNYPNCGIYLLQPAAEGKFICTETFSSLDFEPGAEPDAFTDFAAKFNITDIFIDKDLSGDSFSAINEIAAHIRKNFKRNILIVTSPLADDNQKFLGEYFYKNFPNCGIYLLQPAAKGKFVCTETFSSLTFELEAKTSVFKNFAAHFSLTDIFIENPLNWKSNAFIEWIRVCGLPMKTFPKIAK